MKTQLQTIIESQGLIPTVPEFSQLNKTVHLARVLVLQWIEHYIQNDVKAMFVPMQKYTRHLHPQAVIVRLFSGETEQYYASVMNAELVDEQAHPEAARRLAQFHADVEAKWGKSQLQKQDVVYDLLFKAHCVLSAEDNNTPAAKIYKLSNENNMTIKNMLFQLHARGFDESYSMLMTWASEGIRHTQTEREPEMRNHEGVEGVQFCGIITQLRSASLNASQFYYSGERVQPRIPVPENTRTFVKLMTQSVNNHWYSSQLPCSFLVLSTSMLYNFWRYSIMFDVLSFTVGHTHLFDSPEARIIMNTVQDELKFFTKKLVGRIKQALSIEVQRVVLVDLSDGSDISIIPQIVIPSAPNAIIIPVKLVQGDYDMDQASDDEEEDESVPKQADDQRAQNQTFVDKSVPKQADDQRAQNQTFVDTSFINKYKAERAQIQKKPDIHEAADLERLQRAQNQKSVPDTTMPLATEQQDEGADDLDPEDIADMMSEQPEVPQPTAKPILVRNPLLFESFTIQDRTVTEEEDNTVDDRLYQQSQRLRNDEQLARFNQANSQNPTVSKEVEYNVDGDTPVEVQSQAEQSQGLDLQSSYLKEKPKHKMPAKLSVKQGFKKPKPDQSLEKEPSKQNVSDDEEEKNELDDIQQGLIDSLSRMKDMGTKDLLMAVIKNTVDREKTAKEQRIAQKHANKLAKEEALTASQQQRAIGLIERRKAKADEESLKLIQRLIDDAARKGAAQRREDDAKELKMAEATRRKAEKDERIRLKLLNDEAVKQAALAQTILVAQQFEDRRKIRFASAVVGHIKEVADQSETLRDLINLDAIPSNKAFMREAFEVLSKHPKFAPIAPAATKNAQQDNDLPYIVQSTLDFGGARTGFKVPVVDDPILANINANKRANEQLTADFFREFDPTPIPQGDGDVEEQDDLLATLLAEVDKDAKTKRDIAVRMGSRYNFTNVTVKDSDNLQYGVAPLKDKLRDGFYSPSGNEKEFDHMIKSRTDDEETKGEPFEFPANLKVIAFCSTVKQQTQILAVYRGLLLSPHTITVKLGILTKSIFTVVGSAAYNSTSRLNCSQLCRAYELASYRDSMISRLGILFTLQKSCIMNYIPVDERATGFTPTNKTVEPLSVRTVQAYATIVGMPLTNSYYNSEGVRCIAPDTVVGRYLSQYCMYLLGQNQKLDEPNNDQLFTAYNYWTQNRDANFDYSHAQTNALWTRWRQSPERMIATRTLFGEKDTQVSQPLSYREVFLLCKFFSGHAILNHTKVTELWNSLLKAYHNQIQPDIGLTYESISVQQQIQSYKYAVTRLSNEKAYLISLKSTNAGPETGQGFFVFQELMRKEHAAILALTPAFTTDDRQLYAILKDAEKHLEETLRHLNEQLTQTVLYTRRHGAYPVFTIRRAVFSQQK